MIRADEDGTILALRAVREELFDRKIDEHCGRIVKLMGDGLLVEFASVVDAVACGVEVQQQMAERNAGLPEEQQIVFRVGVNLGDVVIDGDDIQGDGVNVAARLEALSDPGGISISDAVHEQVRDRLDLKFEDLGELVVKNITRPIRVWQWSIGGAQSSGAKPSEPVSLPDKPSIAVLPFHNLSGDPEQEYFADGLAEDIITELSREPHLFVIARNSSFMYKNKSRDIKDIAGELGARYVLEGSVRKAGNRIRLNAQLIDAETNHHVWAERYDRSFEDVFEVQDELTSAIFSTLLQRFVDIGLERTIRQTPTDLDAYQHVLRAFGLINRMNRVDCEAGFKAAEAAIALDPHYGRAHTALAWSHMYRAFLGQTDNLKEAMEMGRLEAQKAIEADRNDYWSYGALGGAELYMGHHERALASLEHAVVLGPNCADMRAMISLILNYLGRPDEGLPEIEQAMRLNPHHPAWYLLVQGRALYLLGRHEETATVLERMGDAGAEFLPTYLLMIANYMAIGCSSDAHDIMAKLLEMSPDFTLAQVSQIVPFKEKEDFDRFVERLQEAGLPE
jgi:adenylate cyclase